MATEGSCLETPAWQFSSHHCDSVWQRSTTATRATTRGMYASNLESDVQLSALEKTCSAAAAPCARPAARGRRVLCERQLESAWINELLTWTRGFTEEPQAMRPQRVAYARKCRERAYRRLFETAKEITLHRAHLLLCLSSACSSAAYTADRLPSAIRPLVQRVL